MLPYGYLANDQLHHHRCFLLCYAYQFLYIPVPWLLAKRKAAKAAAQEATPHNYAVLICARNESAVIADLIGSLRSQTYDQSLLHIFVLADNCTDDTSAIARSAGAVSYTHLTLPTNSLV